MPRYYFNTRIGEETIVDDQGEELRDADQAWELARDMVVELLRDEDHQPSLLTASIVVTDSDGDIVLEFPFSEALIAQTEASPTRH